MSFPPHRHYFPQKEREPLPDEIPIALFIDDEDFWAKDWELAFKIPHVRTMRPSIPEELNQDTKEEITAGIAHFFDTFPPGLSRRVALVIIDQFYDNRDLREKATAFLQTLHEANPTLQVLETSGNPDQTVYPQSKTAIHVGLEQVDIREQVIKAPKSFAIRCMTLFLYTEPAFIEAAKFDTHRLESHQEELSKDYLIQKEQLSWENLRVAPQSDQLFAMIGETKENLQIFWQQANQEQKGLLLHTAWTIIGHLRSGNDLSHYGYHLSRLQALLSSQSDVQ